MQNWNRPVALYIAATDALRAYQPSWNACMRMQILKVCHPSFRTCSDLSSVTWHASSAILTAWKRIGRGSSGNGPEFEVASKAKALYCEETGLWGIRQTITSGRCCKTGSLCFSLELKTSFKGEPVGTIFILLMPSSSHALIRVVRAIFPWPKRAETAVSDRGLGWASDGGSSSTDRANASRVNP